MSKTLRKALSILTLFSEDKPLWTLDEIVEELEIPKTTVFRLLKPFEETGLLQKVSFHQNGYTIQGNVYQLGIRFLELGHIVNSQYEVRNIALPYMRKLKEKLKESVQLVVMDADEAIYIEKVESDNMVRLYTKIGRRAPLYLGACPRILLSFLPDKEIERIISNDLNFEKKSKLSLDELWDSIHTTRQRGFTYSTSELEEGTAAFGTPIFNGRGEIEASLSIASFSAVLKLDNYSEYIYPMWEVSAEISRKLGYRKLYPYLKNIGG